MKPGFAEDLGDDPSKRSRLDAAADETPPFTSDSYSAENDSPADFQMLGLDDVVALPWVPISTHSSIYIPAGVRQLIDSKPRFLPQVSAFANTTQI